MRILQLSGWISIREWEAWSDQFSSRLQWFTLRCIIHSLEPCMVWMWCLMPLFNQSYWRFEPIPILSLFIIWDAFDLIKWQFMEVGTSKQNSNPVRRTCCHAFVSVNSLFRVNRLCCFTNVHFICLGDLLPWLHQSLQVWHCKCFRRRSYKRSRILQLRIWLSLLKRNYSCNSIVTEPQQNFVTFCNSRYWRVLFRFFVFIIFFPSRGLYHCFSLNVLGYNVMCRNW